MRYFVLLLFAFLVALPCMPQPDSLLTDSATTGAADAVKKRAWLAGVETVGITSGIMYYNNSVLSSSPFSKVTFKSMERNLKEFKWWWDEDYMYTNTIEHPYHGAIYYLTARENGMGIGVSSLFSLGGSMLWEVAAEAELPSYNDMVTTPLGGVTLGETLHRVSGCILDESSRGLERIGRELLAGIINPVGAVNRLLRGDAWRVSGQHHRIPVFETSVSAGFRHLHPGGQPTVSSAYINWYATYGDIMGAEGRGLFDYFNLEFTAALGSHQTFLNYTKVTSQLWKSEGQTLPSGTETTWGLYNHFYHVYAEPEYASPGSKKFRDCIGYSEVGSIGPGFAYRTAGQWTWEQQLYLNGVLLGATPVRLLDRVHGDMGYTWGSGYGAKAYSRLSLGESLRLRADIDFSHLFSWIGYDCADAADLKKLRVSDTQGEAGNALTVIVAPTAEYWPTRKLGFEVRGRLMWHKLNYLHHRHTHMRSAEVSAGAILRIGQNK